MPNGKPGRPRMYDGVRCMFPECDAPATAHRLCRIHYSVWPFHMFLHGDKITETRVNRYGYREARVDGIWVLEHRLIMTKILCRRRVVAWRGGKASERSPLPFKVGCGAVKGGALVFAAHRRCSRSLRVGARVEGSCLSRAGNATV